MPTVAELKKKFEKPQNQQKNQSQAPAPALAPVVQEDNTFEITTSEGVKKSVTLRLDLGEHPEFGHYYEIKFGDESIIATAAMVRLNYDIAKIEERQAILKAEKARYETALSKLSPAKKKAFEDELTRVSKEANPAIVPQMKMTAVQNNSNSSGSSNAYAEAKKRLEKMGFRF